MNDFLQGARYAFRGFRRLPEPGLRPFVIVPVLINTVIFALMFWLAVDQFGALLNWLLPNPEAYADGGFLDSVIFYILLIARWLLWPIFVIMVVILMFYSFTIVANLIGSPFNGVLAAKVEQSLTDGRQPPDVPFKLSREIWLATAGELRKLIYFAALAVPLLIITLIPVINVVSPFLWLWYAAWVLSLEYMDFPMGNHGIPFRAQRRIAKQRRWLMFGFGATVTLMTMVPLLNLLAMPTAVIGAATLWSEQLSPASGANGASDRVVEDNEHAS